MDKYREEVKRFLETSANSEFIIYDTETTGLNSSSADIIELSALKVRPENGKFKIIEEFDEFINIGYPIPKEIVEITGITDELLKSDGIPAKDAAERFSAFIGELPVMVGYNSISFDTRFVQKLFYEQLSVSFEPKFQLDVLTMAKEKVERPHKLCNMAERAGATDLQFHRSIDDCKATLIVLDYLLPMYTEKEDDEDITGLSITGIRRWTKSSSLDRLYVSNNKNLQIYYDIPQKKWQIMCNTESEPVINAIYDFAGVKTENEFVEKYC